MRHLSSKKKASSRTENSTPPQKSKKTTPKKRGSSTRNDADTDGETSNTFEVDSVVGSRIIHGQQQYKIHWKGYPSSKDTWELKANLNCPELVNKYLQDQGETDDEENQAGSKRKSSKPEGKPSKKAKDSDNSQAHSNGEGETSSTDTKSNKKSEAKDDDDDEEEYEVEQIIDVTVDSKGKKSFLIRWKNYGPQDDTWEPEANLDCGRLIEEYLISNPILDEAKPGRKTRENPAKRSGFALSPTGKRHSKRSHGRNR